MADMSWWFNRTGEVAKATRRPGQATNYGLAYDLGVAPWGDDADMKAMAEALQGVIASTSPLGAPGTPLPPREPRPWYDWQNITSPVRWAGKQAAGVVGAVDAAADSLGMDATINDNYSELEKEADKRGLTGWDRLKFIGGEDLSETGANFVENATEDGALKTALDVLDTANEYAATTFLTATMAEDTIIPNSDHWKSAHELQQTQGLNAGEAFMGMFWDKETITDEERLAKLRAHNSVLNLGAIGFNLIAGWKYDPTVLVGKGAGVVRNARRGAIAKEGVAATVQRDVLTQGFRGGREAAETAARNQTGLYGRAQGRYGLSLYDRAQSLREAARSETAEKFLSRPEFERSTNGQIMAQIFRETADSDHEFGLVFRATIGDPDAVEELKTLRGEITDKLNAIESNDLPLARANIESALGDYDALAATQGQSAAQAAFVQPQDFFNSPDPASALKRLEDVEARFQSYSTADSWLRRALRGTDEAEGAALQTGSIFNALESVGPKAMRNGEVFPGQSAIRGIRTKVSTWQHDQFSPKVRVIQMPRLAALRRVGAVSLHDPNEGVVGIKASLDQLDYVTRQSKPDFRNRMFEEYAKANTDVSRMNTLGELHHVGFRALAQKYGLDDETMVKLGDKIAERRWQTWLDMTAPRHWKKMAADNRQEKSVLSYVDEDGTLNYMAGDIMDVSQLPDNFPMVNWVDLDHTIRMNRDLLSEVLGKGKASLATRGVLKAGRGIEDAYNIAGHLFNTYWKPAALWSIRWPMRVIGDEGYRTLLLTEALPYLEQGAKGLAHTVFNTGQRGLRTYEWWNGRKVKTSGVNRESLRTDLPVKDPYDHRVQAAIPADEWAVREVDQRRYDGLNAALSRRRIEATVERKPRWAQQWDDRLAAAEANGHRGFYFDPVTHKTANKGFGVSPYPGRLKTFDTKPTARQMDEWVEQNADVLSIPRNRVSAWLDKETGRWHLDVHRVFRTREDAMAAAGRSGLDEFYDIEGGYTRFMDREDPYQHYSSPFVTGSALDMDGSDVDIPGPDPKRRKRKKAGFGEKTLTGPNGEKFVRPEIYGVDPDAPNIWMAANSSSDMTRALYRGHTYVTGKKRTFSVGDRPVYQVGEPGSRQARDWAEAWSQYVNRHMRTSPVWLRMLNGESDDQITKWLRSREGREMVRERLGKVAANPEEYVDQMRAQFDQILPTGAARKVARERDVTWKDVDDIMPFEAREAIDGGSFLHLDSRGPAEWGKRTADKIWQWLASKPNDVLVRHPMANILFNTRRANYLASLPPGTKVTNSVLNAAEAEARAFAHKQIKRTLYNIADEGQAVYMMRYIAPFAQAQFEVINRYARLFVDKPETLAQTFMLFQGSNTMNTTPEEGGLFYVTDYEGNPAEGFSHDNIVHIKIKPWHRPLMKYFGMGDALKYQDEYVVPVASLDLIMQGDFEPLTALQEGDVSKLSAVVPNMGPFVTIPANEFYYRDRSWLTDKGLGKFLFPVGQPKGDTFLERFKDSLMPAYTKRLSTAIQADMDDRAFYGTVARIMDNQYAEGGRKAVNVKEAIDQAKHLYVLRAMSSFAMPFPVNFKPRNQFFIDRYNELQEKNYATADDEFLKQYGADYFAFTQEISTSGNGLAPTAPAMRMYRKNKDLIDRAPKMAGIIVGPWANNGEFSSGVYNWMFDTEMGPGMDNMRTLEPIEERVARTEEALGWNQYGKMMTAINAELRKREAQGMPSTLGANSNSDLYIIREKGLRMLEQQYPGWQAAYNNRVNELPEFLQGAYEVAFDPRLDNRTDMEGLRAYLVNRAKLQQTLNELQAQSAAQGIVRSNSLSFDDDTGLPTGDNAELGAAWRSYVNELKSSNLFFAEIYDRWLEADDLSITVGSGVK